MVKSNAVLHMEILIISCILDCRNCIFPFLGDYILIILGEALALRPSSDNHGNNNVSHR